MCSFYWQVRLKSWQGHPWIIHRNSNLRRRCEHGSDTQVIGTRLDGSLGLFNGRRTDSDDGIFRKQFFRLLDVCNNPISKDQWRSPEAMARTHIVLPEMDAFCPNSEGDIYTIVDQQWDSISFGDFVQLFRCLNQSPCVARFVSILNDSHA